MAQPPRHQVLITVGVDTHAGATWPLWWTTVDVCSAPRASRLMPRVMGPWSLGRPPTAKSSKPAWRVPAAVGRG